MKRSSWRLGVDSALVEVDRLEQLCFVFSFFRYRRCLCSVKDARPGGEVSSLLVAPYLETRQSRAPKPWDGTGGVLVRAPDRCGGGVYRRAAMEPRFFRCADKNKKQRRLVRAEAVAVRGGASGQQCDVHRGVPLLQDFLLIFVAC